MSDSVRPHRWQPTSSPVPGILQARTLEWVAISFSNARKWKVKVKSFSRVRPSATPWTAAYQASSSMGFSRQEYWSGVPLPSPGIVIMVAKISLRKTIPTPKFGLRSCCGWLSRVARDHQSALERSIILGNYVDVASLCWYGIWWKSPRVFRREYTIHITQHCVTLMNFFFFFF